VAVGSAATSIDPIAPDRAMSIAILKSALIFVASHIAMVTLALALFAAG
jgi:hypothetical protein